MESLTLEKLGEDKGKIETLIRRAQYQIQQLNTDIVRWDGVLTYLNDNIKNMKEEEKPNDKSRFNNENSV